MWWRQDYDCFEHPCSADSHTRGVAGSDAGAQSVAHADAESVTDADAPAGSDAHAQPVSLAHPCSRNATG